MHPSIAATGAPAAFPQYHRQGIHVANSPVGSTNNVGLPDAYWYGELEGLSSAIGSRLSNLPNSGW